MGFDGVPYSLIQELIKERKLPNFKSIMESGSYGILTSTIPPLSPVAWPSLLTGENPGKHGIFSFFDYDGGLFRSNTSKKIQGKTFLDILNTFNKKVIAVNIPCTFPPWKINGIMIPGFPVPEKNARSYPPDVINTLENNVGKYHVDIPSEGFLNIKGLTDQKFLSEIYYVTKRRTEAILYMMNNFEWDLFMGVYTCTDRILHAYFGYFNKSSDYYEHNKRMIISKYFTSLDYQLGKILSNIDKDTTVLIISDHGFESYNKGIGINNVLAGAGLISPIVTMKEKIKKEFLKILNKINFIELSKIRKIKKINFMKDPFKLSRAGEFEDAVAYCIHILGISINKNNIDTDYDVVRDNIYKLFLTLHDPESKEKVIEKIYKKEELYYGDKLDQAPDLIIVPKKGYSFGRWTKNHFMSINVDAQGIVRTGEHSGTLARDGIFFIKNSEIKKDFRYDASILDVAPTILRLLGIPVTSNMDGHVLKDIFEPDSILRNNIGRAELKMTIQPNMMDFSKEEEEIILRKLKKLGYIE